MTAVGASAPTTPAPAAAAAAPRVHVPDEPSTRRERWGDAVLEGTPLGEVLVGAGGVADWLWARWRVLERAGLDRAGFDTVVLGYRRELWLWLAGERSWEQCCSGLIGRLGRRLAP